jgi:hypothetical protein
MEKMKALTEWEKLCLDAEIKGLPFSSGSRLDMITDWRKDHNNLSSLTRELAEALKDIYGYLSRDDRAGEFSRVETVLLKAREAGVEI